MKQELLAAYFRKKNLNITDIGFKTPARIYINERLTSANRVIFNRAAEAKNANVIYRYYTRRGLVIIQRDATSKPSTVLSMGELEVLMPVDNAGTNKNRSMRLESASDRTNSKKPAYPRTVDVATSESTSERDRSMNTNNNTMDTEN